MRKITSMARFAAILGAAIALAVPASAAAAGQAWNGRTIDLKFPAPPGAASCVDRPIELGFGDYLWRVGHRFGSLPTNWPVVHLKETVPWRVYTWSDCIVSDGLGYRHTSHLLWKEGAWGAPAYTFYHSASSSLVPSWFGSTLDRG